MRKSILHLVSADPPRVLVDGLRREGLETLVHASLDRFLAERGAAGPACLLIDLRTCPEAGTDRRLARRGMPPVVFLGAEPGDVSRAVALMKRGAADYLEADTSVERIVATVREQLERDRERLARDAVVAEVRRGLARLTDREAEVLELVVVGRTSKAIALDLGVSKKTIDLHRSHVMHKLEADSVVDLVRLVLLEQASRAT